MTKRRSILFCGPIDKPGKSGRYIISGLEQLGYQVFGYDYRTNKNHEEDLLNLAEREKPFYFFTLKGEELSPELINRLKASGCITILWFEHYPLEDWMVALAKAHDFVVANVENDISHLKRMGVENIKWIHQGFAPEFFGIDGPTKNVCYSDVAMIGSMGGSLYKKRCEIVTKLRRNNIDIKWWGSHLSWQLKNLRFFLLGVHRAWAGKEVYMKDFADVIRHIKIFLGQDADMPPATRCLSNRSLAVLGCGGFYLCNRTLGVESVYEIGTEIEVFDTDEEMLDKICYYLFNDKQRRCIALAGQRKVLNNYTYRHQVERIMNWVDEHL